MPEIKPMFVLTVRTGSFGGDGREDTLAIEFELARILREVATRVESGQIKGLIQAEGEFRPLGWQYPAPQALQDPHAVGAYEYLRPTVGDMFSGRRLPEDHIKARHRRLMRFCTSPFGL
jgi:hypothetical protein